MYFQIFDVPGLDHLSYLVGCADAGTAAVIDPERNVDRYLKAAAEESLNITHVLETHVHADYLSGAGELARRTGAEYLVSGYTAGDGFEVRRARCSLLEGMEIVVGNLRLEVLHTPGHTPEHISFLLYDRSRSAALPLILFCGDFLLPGTLGRPDLLGAARAEEQAGALYRSVTKKLPGLPDSLLLAPAHGSGSLCGSGAISAGISTLGYERQTNRWLDPDRPRDRFVGEVLSDLAPPPPWYGETKLMNAKGPPPFPREAGMTALPAGEFADRMAAGTTVLDVRSQGRFCAGHVPGAINLATGPRLGAWAGWAFSADTPLLLVADDPAGVEYAVRCLARVGRDEIRGYLEGGVAAWGESGRPLETLTEIGPSEAWRQASEGPASILDVRPADAFRGEHVPGSRHLPGWEIDRRAAELPSPEHPLLVICRSGNASTHVASVLRRRGYRMAANVAGGIKAWRTAGLPLETPR